MFSSLRNRLFLTYGLVIFVVLGIVGAALVAYIIQNPAVDRQTYAVLEDIADRILERNIPRRRLPEILGKVGNLQEFRVLIVSQNQAIIYDSMEEEAAPIQPQIQRTGPSQRGNFRDLEHDVWLFVWRSLDEGNYLVVARQRISRTSILFSQRLRDVLRDGLIPPLIRIGIIVLVLALILAFWISSWVAGPLTKLSFAARGISGGDFLKVPEDGPREVKNLAAAFNEMSDQVKATQKSQRDFIANVSHELKTPLTSIQGFSQAILDGTVDSQKSLLDAADVIYSEAGRMHRLVVELLDLTGITSGSIEIKMSSVDLNSLLMKIVERVTSLAAMKQIQIMCEWGDLPAIIGDRDRLQQVFTNLVDNAIKYSHRGGCISLETEILEVDACVWVKDNGIGINSEEIPRIFERFYQVDSSRSGGKERGSGLGLPIAAEIVKAHGGSIVVESQPGQGSIFVVKIPVTQIGGRST